MALLERKADNGTERGGSMVVAKLTWKKSAYRRLAKGYTETLYRPTLPLPVRIVRRRLNLDTVSAEMYIVMYKHGEHSIEHTLAAAKKCAEALIKERGETDGKAYSG